MKFLRRVNGCTKRDRHKNEDIRHDPNVYAIIDKIEEYGTKSKQHIEKMPNDRITNKILQYKPKCRRTVGLPKNRYSDVSCRNRQLA